MSHGQIRSTWGTTSLSPPKPTARQEQQNVQFEYANSHKHAYCQALVIQGGADIPILLTGTRD